MKNQELIVLAIAAFGVWQIMKNNRLASANTVNNMGVPVNGTSQIYTGATPGTPGYGWRYFSDGTAIDPQGNYYQNGVKVWSAN